MNEIKIEIRWKQTDKTPIELTKTFFQRNEWAVLKQNDVINGVFSFGCADSKLVDIQINDRNGKEADWAKQLINALKQESDHISSVYLYSNKELYISLFQIAGFHGSKNIPIYIGISG